MFMVYFKRDSNPTRYEIRSELSLEEHGVIGPLFNLTFQVRAKSFINITLIYCRGKHWLANHLHSLLLVCQIQNLGYFPVNNLQLNIEIPEMTKNGNQLLQISDFYIDQVSLSDLK